MNGLRAIDGATIDPNGTRQIGFFACSPDPTKSQCKVNPSQTQPAAEPIMRYCDDIQPIFIDHCEGCHAAPGGPQPPAAGLVLDLAQGVRFTAIGKAAQGSTTGAVSGPMTQGKHFGVNMPVIDPEHPGTSWLMYKLILAEPIDGGDAPIRPICGTDAGVPVTATPPSSITATQWRPLSDSERAILSDYVLGRSMPFPTDPSQPYSSPTNSDNPPLTFDEMERLRLWIKQGASVPSDNCVPCAIGDGGAPISDAGGGG